MTKSRNGRWAVAREKLGIAHDKLAEGQRPAGFAELLKKNELTAALDALEAAAEGAGPEFWTAMAEAANWIGLYDRERELQERASRHPAR